ncbi:hypothetical protein [Nonomuraea sp. SBT364]|uniref:hypothetical protein n=1 Tax=Nonomuraea sp. SBT364 TaxID=1580530 RepID=UPI0012E1AD62|nr:hypothetical protein [Nonomuraea sp. SBT364]
MIRFLTVILTAGALLAGVAPAASASAPPSFCEKARPCVAGGDTGWTWVHAAASSGSEGRAVAAKLLRNAEAVHGAYGVPEGVSIFVIRKGACWRAYGASEREPGRACTLKRVQREL